MSHRWFYTCNRDSKHSMSGGSNSTPMTIPPRIQTHATIKPEEQKPTPMSVVPLSRPASVVTHPLEGQPGMFVSPLYAIRCVTCSRSITTIATRFFVCLSRYELNRSDVISTHTITCASCWKAWVDRISRWGKDRVGTITEQWKQFQLSAICPVRTSTLMTCCKRFAYDSNHTNDDLLNNVCHERVLQLDRMIPTLNVMESLTPILLSAHSLTIAQQSLMIPSTVLRYQRIVFQCQQCKSTGSLPGMNPPKRICYGWATTLFEPRCPHRRLVPTRSSSSSSVSKREPAASGFIITGSTSSATTSSATITSSTSSATTTQSLLTRPCGCPKFQARLLGRFCSRSCATFEAQRDPRFQYESTCVLNTLLWAEHYGLSEPFLPCRAYHDLPRTRWPLATDAGDRMRRELESEHMIRTWQDSSNARLPDPSQIRLLETDSHLLISIDLTTYKSFLETHPDSSWYVKFVARFGHRFLTARDYRRADRIKHTSYLSASSSSMSTTLSSVPLESTSSSVLHCAAHTSLTATGLPASPSGCIDCQTIRIESKQASSKTTQPSMIAAPALVSSTRTLPSIPPPSPPSSSISTIAPCTTNSTSSAMVVG